MEFDEEEFDEEMAKQKSRSRAAAAVDTDDWNILMDDMEQEFIGYDYLEAEVKITDTEKSLPKKMEICISLFSI